MPWNNTFLISQILFAVFVLLVCIIRFRFNIDEKGTKAFCAKLLVICVAIILLTNALRAAYITCSALSSILQADSIVYSFNVRSMNTGQFTPEIVKSPIILNSAERDHLYNQLKHAKYVTRKWYVDVTELSYIHVVNRGSALFIRTYSRADINYIEVLTYSIFGAIDTNGVYEIDMKKVQ